MKDASGVRRQMTEIGDRFLRRTIGEAARLRELLGRLRAGDGAALNEIETLVHKMHGSGAMFGFDALSSAAHECERLAMRAAHEAGLADHIEAALCTLEARIEEAARARGIDP